MKKFSEDIDFAILKSKKLSEKYSSWIIQEISKGEKFSSEVFKKTSKNNTEKCKNILKRINKGISILEKNKIAQKAFMFMNHSMYFVTVHYQIKDFKKDINYKKLEDLKKVIGDLSNWLSFF